MSDEADRLYEQVLVLRCQARDEAAFAELVDRYQPRLRYYLRKLLRHEASAEDVLQDVWLAVFRAVPRLADLGAFRAWLYRIARDRAMGLLRRRRSPSVGLEGVELIDEAEAPMTAEDVAIIHAALDELTEDHREILVLRYLEDMTNDEIAQVVGCPAGTVRSRLHYARLALRGALERRKVRD